MAVDPIGFAPLLASALSASGRSGVGTLPGAGADLEWRRCAITRTQLAVPGARSTPEVAVAGSPGRPQAGPRSRHRTRRGAPGRRHRARRLRQDRPARRPGRRVRHRRRGGPPRAARRRAGSSAGGRAAGRRRPPVFSGRTGAVAGWRLARSAIWSWHTGRGLGRTGSPRSVRRWPPAAAGGAGRPGSGRGGRPGPRCGSASRPRPAGAWRRWSSWCYERTAGLPVLVDRLLDALLEQAGADRARIRCPIGRRPGCWPSSGTRWRPRNRACAGCCWPRRSVPRWRPRCWCRCSAWPARRSWTSCWNRRAPPAC